eukprot:12078670-Alexandrium_andersonii.AAC.1
MPFLPECCKMASRPALVTTAHPEVAMAVCLLSLPASVPRQRLSTHATASCGMWASASLPGRAANLGQRSAGARSL